MKPIVAGKRLFIALLLLMSQSLCISIYSQDLIKQKALSIVDTATNKLMKAQFIYDWIINNLTYDMDAYKRGYSIQSTIETFKTKKGINPDFASLYAEMCKDVGIEVYTVDGYCKDVELYNNGGYYRTKHCWSLLLIDSTCYRVDVTWGNGYLLRKPRWFDKLLHFLFRKPYVSPRLVYVKNPTNAFFNFDRKKFSETYMPIVPMWQMTPYPESMESFEQDASEHDTVRYDYMQEIERYRRIPEWQQIFESGLKGKSFNSKNNFDIANSYKLRASLCDFRSFSNDSSNLFILKDIQADYRMSLYYISLYKMSVDSIFPTRMKEIKMNLKNAKSMMQTFKKCYKKGKKDFPKNQAVLSQKYKSLIKKEPSLIAGKEYFINSKIPIGILQKDTLVDSTLIHKNWIDIGKSAQLASAYYKEIDSLKAICASDILLDDTLSRKFLNYKKNLLDDILGIYYPLTLQNNKKITNTWKDLYNYFLICNLSYARKTENVANTNAAYAKLMMNFNYLLVEYYKQQKLSVQCFGYTLDTLRSLQTLLHTRKLVIESYDKIIAIAPQYAEFTNKLIDFYASDKRLNDEIYKPSLKNLDYYIQFEELLYEDQKESYKKEKQLIKLIQRPCLRAVSSIESKMSRLQ
jgi:hypothetical protein